jgi:hypothetical protein
LTEQVLEQVLGWARAAKSPVAQILLELSSLIQVRAHSELLVLWLGALQLSVELLALRLVEPWFLPPAEQLTLQLVVPLFLPPVEQVGFLHKADR